jgi:hypothetical protein
VDAASIDAIMSGRFRLGQAPTLAAPSLSDSPIAFTRLRSENDKLGMAGPVPPEGSFAFQVMLKPVQSWEFRTNRGHGSLPPTKPGDTFLFDLSENPQIQLHSAFDMVRNGYLADTFLQDGTNKRTDRYGGSVEGRARLSLELVEALLSAFGPGRVGVRVSPSGQWGSISDSNPDLTFGYFAEQLNRYKLAYLHIIEPRVKGVETIDETRSPVASSFLRRIYQGNIIAAGGFDRAGAEAILETGDADLVAFGRYFTSNPDLPERLRRNLPLSPYRRETFWGGTEYLYNDFPAYSDSVDS